MLQKLCLHPQYINQNRKKYGMNLLSFILLFIVYILIIVSYFHGTNKLTFVDSLYFAVTTMSSVGYGDITPISNQSKMITCIFIVFGIILLSYGVSCFTIMMIARDEILRNKHDSRVSKIIRNITNIRTKAVNDSYADSVNKPSPRTHTRYPDIIAYYIMSIIMMYMLILIILVIGLGNRSHLKRKVMQMSLIWMSPAVVQAVAPAAMAMKKHHYLEKTLKQTISDRMSQ
jgi:hypothetical protein